MATNQTQNYGLNQWELSDSVIMAEFNADNQKVDAALSALNQRIDTAVADAVDTATKNLNEAIAAVTATIPRIKTGSYVGTGTFGSENPNKLTFDFQPKLFIIWQYDYSTNSDNASPGDTRFVAIYNTPQFHGHNGAGPYDGSSNLYFKWGENYVSWCGTSAATQANVNNGTYRYFAMG